MGGNTIKQNENWNDPVPDIKQIDDFQITLDIKSNFVDRMNDQQRDFITEFEQEFNQKSKDTAQRLMNSPLVSQKNKDWVEKQGLEKVLQHYMKLKKDYFLSSFHQAAMSACRRLSQLFARQVLYSKIERNINVDGSYEEIDYVVGPVWHNREMNQQTRDRIMYQTEITYDQVSYKIFKGLVELLTSDIETEVLNVLTRSESKNSKMQPTVQQVWQITKDAVESVPIPKMLPDLLLVNLVAQAPQIHSLQSLSLQSLVDPSANLQQLQQYPTVQQINTALPVLQNMNWQSPVAMPQNLMAPQNLVFLHGI